MNLPFISGRLRVCISALALTAVSVLANLAAAEQADLVWVRQISTDSGEIGHAVTVDGQGTAYFTSAVSVPFGTYYGAVDAFTGHYDFLGNALWSSQIGTAGSDDPNGIWADRNGSVYVAGETDGKLGPAQYGDYDAFLTKYSEAGARQWTAQLGTNKLERARAVYADPLGNVFISGETDGGNLFGTNGGCIVGEEGCVPLDAFIAKYSPDGSLLWGRQVGAAIQDVAFGVTADASGNSYMSGVTFWDLGGVMYGQEDTFVVKFDPAGNQQWLRHFGTADREFGRSLSANAAGEVYVLTQLGQGFGLPLPNDASIQVNKFDTDGNMLWERHFNSDGNDFPHSIYTDSRGFVYIAGETYGDLGAPNLGLSDIFVMKLDPAGNLLWTKQFGTAQYDVAYGVATDGHGTIYLTGSTSGSLGGPAAGGADIYVAQLVEVPEPATLFLALTTLAAAALVRRRP